MVQLYAFRRSLVALALCSVAFAVSATPASARSHHGARRYARAHDAGSHARRHYAHRYYRHIARTSRWDAGVAQMQVRGFANTNASAPSSGMVVSTGFGSSDIVPEARRYHRHIARTSRWDAGVAQMQARGFANTHASTNASAASGGMVTSAGFGSSDIVTEARRYIGGNPTSRGSLWCARFMNMVLERSGHHGTGSDMASSFAHYGQRVSGPQIGAIAVMARRGGGHVGVVSGIDASGNPIVVSGNNGNRVREAVLSRSRIYAYVIPTS
jgi:uncharacterized protein (TIGR02594 family)